MARTPTTPAGAAERRRLLELLARPPDQVAPALLGHLLVRPPRRHGERALALRIVEAEAYLGRDDPGAHAFRGPTPRTRVLWGPPGHVYVYLIYGVHHCLNFVAQAEGVPGCVLLRAAEPVPSSGLAPDAARGPGRLCRVLGLDTRDSGGSLFDPQARVWLRSGPPSARLGVSPRIGVHGHVAEHWPLRFFDPDSAAVSGSRRFNSPPRACYIR